MPDDPTYEAIQRENRRRSRSAVLTVFVVIPTAVALIAGALLLLDHYGAFGGG